MLQPKRVFISYAREDTEWAKETFRILRGQRVAVYLDVDSNRAGDDWPKRLRVEVDEADQVRLGWSRDAAASDWVRKEYTAALKKPPGSLLIDLLDTTPLPSELTHVQAEPSKFRTTSLADRVCRPFTRALRHPPNPSHLLRYEYGVVPFQGRQVELETSIEWAGTDARFAAHLITGVGGCGKTRFAAQLCGELQRRGWDAAFLDPLAFTTEILSTTGATEELMQAHRRPRLVVVDQAETWITAPLERLLQVGLRKSSGNPVRLLLLARSMGDWWDELLDDFDLREARDHEITVSGLEPLQTAADFQEARGAFAEALRRTVIPVGTPDLSDEDFGRILVVHVAALLSVLGEQVPRPATPAHADRAQNGGTNNASRLLTELLMHEQSHWRVIGEEDKNVDAATRSSAALMTLLGGCDATPQSVRAILGGNRYFGALTPAMQDRVARVLIDQYGHSGRIEPLRPEMLGEQLIEIELRREPAPSTGWVKSATREQITYSLRVLDRIKERWPEAREWYEAVLREPAALEATGESMLDLLGKVGAAPELIPDLTWQIKLRVDALRLHNRSKDVISEVEAAEQSLRSVADQRHDVQTELNWLASIKEEFARSVAEQDNGKPGVAPVIGPAPAPAPRSRVAAAFRRAAAIKTGPDRTVVQRAHERELARVTRGGRIADTPDLPHPDIATKMHWRAEQPEAEVPRERENDIKHLQDALDVLRQGLEQDESRAKAAGIRGGPVAPG